MKKFKVVWGFAVAALMTTCLATADDKADVGEAISNCFHPFCDYVDMSLGEPYAIGEHTRAADGYVRYKQLDNHVRRMPFQIQSRVVDGDKMFLVLPDAEHDTGNFGPSSTCAMRNWH